MKIHITNKYNFDTNDQMVIRQHRIADIGRKLDFFEMGVFSYPVETDSPSELSKRLDGIIASLEPEDGVIIQLPTGNGFYYEQMLFHKIRSYRDTKIALLFHDAKIFFDTEFADEQDNYMSLCKKADVVIVPSDMELAKFRKEGMINLFSLEEVKFAEDISERNGTITNLAESVKNNAFKDLCTEGFYIKKLLIDVVNAFFEQQMYEENVSPIVENDEIQIGFGLHDKNGNYYEFIAIVIQSILDHTTSKIRFHILHDSTVDEKIKKKLAGVAVSVHSTVSFHYLDDMLFNDIQELVEKYTVGAMFRIMLPEVLPYLSKIIYLDGALLVNRDIKGLWEVDIQEYYLAAVPDMEVCIGNVTPMPVKHNAIEANRYFNSGVLYLNLEEIRKKGNMRNEVLDYLEHTQESDFPDQNALNVVYKDKVLLLDYAWNYLSIVAHRNKERQLEKRIYHYAGERFNMHVMTGMDELYYETMSRIPEQMEKAKRYMQNTLERIVDRSELLAKVVSEISAAGKTRVFYGEETYAMKFMYQMLSVKKEDYRVLMTPTNVNNSILPCEKLDILGELDSEFIVFVLPEADDWSSIRRLEQMGLVNEKDFFVIPRLLPPNRGGYLY